MKTISKLITVIIRRIIAVLKPSTKINDYINNAKAVYQSMLNNAYFPASSLSITLAQFNTDITALVAAEVNFSATPPTGTKAQRDAAKKVVAADLRKLLASVQAVADANPAKAEDIITSANFQVKHAATHTKFVGAKNTNVSGTITLVAPEGGAHEWAQLAADGVTWLTLRATTGGKKTVTGLTAVKSYTFRTAPILPEKDGEGEWTVFAALLVV